MQRFRNIFGSSTRGVAIALCLFGLASTCCSQQTWPSKPIRLVVGFPAGGSVDTIARNAAQQISVATGQPAYVENRPGAGGNLAASEVKRAAPDGYTILVTSTSVVTANPSLFKSSVGFADLEQVSTIAKGAMYLVVRPGFNATNFNGLIAFAKSNPGALTYGSPGVGTPNHLATELMKMKAGFQATHVPYKGGPPALQDLMSGQIDFVLDPGLSLPYIQAGKLKLLGVMSSSRSPFFPQAPTLREQGFQGANLDMWFGVFMPKGTPLAVQTRLAEILKSFDQPRSREALASLGIEPAVVSGPEFKRLLINETQLFSGLIRDLGITVD